LFIGGDGVALGYLNNPQLTAGKFTPQTFTDFTQTNFSKKLLRGVQGGSILEKSPPGRRRLYKTGDLCRWIVDGNIEFLGRVDTQVKVRGFRIELEEIENHLRYHEDIADAAVILREDTGGEKYLCAYLVTRRTFEDSEAGDYLAKKLPDFMIPAYFMELGEIPLNPNGKVDKRALPEPGAKQEGYIPPSSDIEKQMAEIWSAVLNVDEQRISVDSNFFKLGGHSLKATVLVARIHKETDVYIELAEVFKTPTIRELARIVEKAEKERFIAVQPVEKKSYYPLSAAQKRLFILQQMEAVYNMTSLLEIEGDLDHHHLEQTFKQLITRHESLRTSFEMAAEEPVQRIHSTEGSRQWAVDSRDEPLCSPVQLGETIKDFVRPFDLARAPLLRVGLINTGNSHILMLDLHHIISDGISMGIFIKEFGVLYREEPLPELRLQYKDYAQWQEQEFRKEAVRAMEEYWLAGFAQEIPLLHLPLDYPRPELQSFAGSTEYFGLTPEESGALKELAAAADASLYMVLLAVFNVLLAKLSGNKDIVTGTPVAGRRHQDLQSIIGMFVGTLALRNFPHPAKPFIAFLKEVKERTLAAFENQDFPFEDLVDKLAVERDAGRNPVFDVMFALQNIDMPQMEMKGLKIKPYKYESNTANFDLFLQAFESERGLRFSLNYCTKLFKKETILRFIQYFKTIISSAIARPGGKISGIEILTEEERQRVLYDFNDTAAPFPGDKTIHRLFAEQAGRTPERIAVVGNIKPRRTRRVFTTYKEIDQQADNMARLLRTKGVSFGSVISIKVERSIEMIVGILAILKAGGAYLPIDPGYPEERIDFMLKDSSAMVLVSSEFEVIDLCRGEPLCSPEVLFHHSSFITHHSGNLAYVIYTSGSTGKPKGVMVEHASVVNLLTALFSAYPMYETDSYLLKTPCVFDVSISELFGWILGGSRMVILLENAEKDPQIIIDTIELCAVTFINFVPSMFNVFVDHLDHHNIKKLSSLKYIFLAGEALLPYQVNKFRKLSTNIVLENLYGPTEATVYAGGYSLAQWDGAGNIPIGKPLANTMLYILDEDFHLQPIGVPGELCISGTGLARGYINNPELTKEKFQITKYKLQTKCKIQNTNYKHMSYMSHMSYIYRTGDLAHWLPDGNIQFLGRLDHQVKIRGYRIELGEVENHLLKHPLIKEAVVTLRARSAGKDRDPYLCAYFIGEKELEAVQLKEYLAKYLPGYMIPLFFVPIKEIPLTVSGKVNRKALPEPEIKEKAPAPPRDRVDETLLAIWEELLGVGKGSIGIDSNFFDLGGHSLKATLLAAKIHKEFQVKVSLAQIFKTPFIRALTEQIRGAEEEKYISIEPAPHLPHYPLSSAQKRFYVLQQMEPRSTTYNMPLIVTLVGNLDREKLENAFQQLIQRHESFRTAFETVENEPVQKIYQSVDFQAGFFEATERGQADKIVDTFIRPFDLSKAPLLRVGLVKVREQEHQQGHILMMDMHHILSDAHSHSILLGELLSLYRGETLPQLKLQYKDYSLWQYRQVQSGEMKKQEEYWLNQFRGDLPILDIPTDFPRPEVQGFEGSITGFEISSETAQKLRTFARAERATVFMVILAAANILLYKLSGQEEIVVGTTVAGRRHPDLENIIGVFLNTLALRNYPAGDKTFLQFFREVRKHTLGAFDNQDYQFEDLVQKAMANVNRDTSRNPLFDVLVSFTSRDPAANDGLQQEGGDDGSGLRIEPYGREASQARFDMLLAGGDAGDQMRFGIEYSTRLFKRETIQRYIRYFKEIVSVVAEDADICLKDIKISTRLGSVKSTAYEQQSEFEF